MDERGANLCSIDKQVGADGHRSRRSTSPASPCSASTQKLPSLKVELVPPPPGMVQQQQPGSNRDAGAGTGSHGRSAFLRQSRAVQRSRICEAAGVDAARPAAMRWCMTSPASTARDRPISAFFAGGGARPTQFASTQAGFCFVAKDEKRAAPQGCVAVPCASVQHAFAAAARLFYPQSGLARWAQAGAIDPTARIGEGVSARTRRRASARTPRSATARGSAPTP